MVIPDLIPAKDGIVDRHPAADHSEKNWIPGQARNDKKEHAKRFPAKSHRLKFFCIPSDE